VAGHVRADDDEDLAACAVAWAVDSLQALALDALAADCAVAVVTHGNPALGWIAPTLRDLPPRGVPGRSDVCMIPIGGTFCALGAAEPVAVADAAVAERGCPCTLRHAEAMRAYLSVEIPGRDGEGAFGRLCVMTRHPRIWSREDKARLTRLAGSVADALALGIEATARRRGTTR
jgi:hypothetical protein